MHGRNTPLQLAKVKTVIIVLTQMRGWITGAAVNSFVHSEEYFHYLWSMKKGTFRLYSTCKKSTNYVRKLAQEALKSREKQLLCKKRRTDVRLKQHS